MHPVLAKLSPVIANIRKDRSQRIDCININPADADELGLKLVDELFGAPVIRDANVPKLGAQIGVTQERDAFDDRFKRR